MAGRKKYILGGLIVAAALGVLLFFGLSSCSIDYYTVGELLEKGSSIYGEKVQVSGSIVEGSVDWNAEALHLKFVIAEENQELAVNYDGARPDAFAEEKDVLVRGRLEPDGIFHASSLTFQCPSKYASGD